MGSIPARVTMPKGRQRKLSPGQIEEAAVKAKHCFCFEVGVDDGEGPPVPIPNTEVKLTRAEDTWLEAARDNRKTPTQIFLNSSAGRACDC